MSMNLFGKFIDSKGRTVAKLNFRQTPTKLSYKIVPEHFEYLELTLDNFEEVLKEYFDPNNRMVSKPFDTVDEYIKYTEETRKEKYKDLKENTFFNFDEEYCRMSSEIDKPIIPVSYLGKYWNRIDEYHIEDLLDTLKCYGEDYKCFLFVM